MGSEMCIRDRDSDAQPRSRIGASTFTSRRTRGCGDKGEPDACEDGSSPEGARGCRRDRTVRRPTVVSASNRRETVTRIVTDGAEGESYNSARGTNTHGRRRRVDDARSGSRTREGNVRGRRTSDNDDGDGDDDYDRDRGRGRARPRRRAHRSSSSEDEDDGRDARRHRIRPRTFDGNTLFETF